MSLNDNYYRDLTKFSQLKNRKMNFLYPLNTQVDPQAKQVVLLQKATGVISTVSMNVGHK